MKKIILLAAVMCATSGVSFAADTGTKVGHADTAPTAASSELMGFDTVTYDGQEVRLAVTKEATAEASAFCRQYVASYTHEIVSPSESSASLVPVDKTTIVLGKYCTWTKKG